MIAGVERSMRKAIKAQIPSGTPDQVVHAARAVMTLLITRYGQPMIEALSIELPVRSTVETVPVAALEGVATSIGIDTRCDSIRQAHRDGVRLPPIVVWRTPWGFVLGGGNHRLTVAREDGHETIDVEWLEEGAR